MHHLRPAPGSRTAKTRVGRGEGGKGKSAGRGTKGSKARQTMSQGFEGGQMPLHMRLPKLPGFKNRFRVEYAVVNVSRLEALFKKGDVVDVDALFERGVIKSKTQPVKVLGDGELTKALKVKTDKVSAPARAKIEAAGGTVETL
mgnify:FL=1